MITIQEGVTNKMPGITSLYITFDYNQEIVNSIKTFQNYAYDKKTYTWELPITSLSKLIELLNPIDDITLKLLSDTNENREEVFKLGEYKMKPFKHQEDAIQYGLNNDKFLLLDAPGLGKAVSLDTKILTSTGTKKMGDIVVGDELFDEFGNPCTVKEIFNHDNLNMYKLNFSNGSSVICCEDHLWSVKFSKKRLYKYDGVYTTQDIINFSNIRRKNMYIQANGPIQFKGKKAPIPPYTMALILCCCDLSDEMLFTSVYTSVLDKAIEVIKKCGSIKYKLKTLGLYGVDYDYRFIPDIYKYGSANDRKDFVRGLMDSLAATSGNHQVKLKFKSIKLAEDARFIISSIGAFARIDYNTLSVYVSSNDISDLFSIEDRRKIADKLKHKQELVRLESFEKSDCSTGRCLTVDSPNHLYLLGNCIPTHNTMSIIYLAKELKEREGLKHCLVICGINTLKMNWRNEIFKTSDLSCKVLGERTTKKGKYKIGSIHDRLEDLKHNIDEFFIVTNCETIRNEDIVKAINSGPNKIDMIVVDEIHKVSNNLSAQGKGILKLDKAKHLIGATGTLLTNSPVNAFLPLKWIGAERGTFTNFKYYYCNFTGSFNNILLGFRNLNVLQDQINKYSLRRTKDLLDLPEKNVIDEIVEMDPHQETFYENIKNGIIEEVDKVNLDTSTLLSMVTRLRQATSSPSILSSSEIESSKINRACDLAEELISNGEKVVIFSIFKETLNVLMKKLEIYKPLLCTGDVDESEINKNIDLFQNDDNHMIMLATVQKMSTGITLTRASNEIVIDCSWTKAQNEQMEDRIHRIGSKKPVFIHYLWNNNTIDLRVKDIVESKEAVSDFVVDGSCSPKLLKKLKDIVLDLQNT